MFSVETSFFDEQQKILENLVDSIRDDFTDSGFPNFFGAHSQK